MLPIEPGIERGVNAFIEGKMLKLGKAEKLK
jgi:hypothetical protein